MTSSFRGSLQTDWAKLWQGAALAGFVSTASVMAAPPSQDAAPRITPGVSVVVHADTLDTPAAPRRTAPGTAKTPAVAVPSTAASPRRQVIQQVAADDEQSAVQQRLQELYEREGKSMPDQDWSYEMKAPDAGQPGFPGQMPQGYAAEPKRGFFDRIVPGFLRKSNSPPQQNFSNPPQPQQFSQPAQPQMMPQQAQPQFVQPQMAQPSQRPSGFRFPWQKAPQPRQYVMPQGTPAQMPSNPPGQPLRQPTGPVRNPTGEFATRTPAPAPQPSYGSPYLTPLNQGADAPKLSTTDGDQPKLTAPNTFAEPALLGAPDESTPLASQPQLSSPSAGDDDLLGGPDQQELANSPALESTDAPQLASPSPDRSADGPKLTAKPSLLGEDLLLEEPRGVDNDTLDFGDATATVKKDVVEEELPFSGQKLDTSIETRMATDSAAKLPKDEPQIPATHSALPGLKGYCLVTLRNERRLVLANSEHSSEVDGTKYLFASAAAKKTFDENPELYVPAGAGRDVVKQAEGRVALGSIDHAVWYKGRLFMFDSKETLENFADGPAEFAKVVLTSTQAPKVAKPAVAAPAKPTATATPQAAQTKKPMPEVKVPSAAAPATAQEKLPVLE